MLIRISMVERGVKIQRTSPPIFVGGNPSGDYIAPQHALCSDPLLALLLAYFPPCLRILILVYKLGILALLP